MLINYNDIKSRINEEPKWYTPQGVPRYCDFRPEETGIYSKYALLVEIECQACRKRFMVGEGYTRENFNAIINGDEENFLNDLNKILAFYHYGDPPRHDCERGGETMNCHDIRFVEVWEQQYNTETRKLPNGEEYTVLASPLEWVRRSELEKSCDD